MGQLGEIAERVVRFFFYLGDSDAEITAPSRLRIFKQTLPPRLRAFVHTVYVSNSHRTETGSFQGHLRSLAAAMANWSACSLVLTGLLIGLLQSYSLGSRHRRLLRRKWRIP